VEDYNSTTNGRTTRPIVADPVGTDLNRAAIEWQSGTTLVAVGRQRINLDNQRFIGGSAWRQNEQTFDGATASTRIGSRVEFSYGYVYQVNRVYGPDDGTQAAEWHGRIHLLHARYDAGKAGRLTAFSYLMDLHNASGQSTGTTGLLWTVAPELGAGWSLPIAASYARQSDRGDAPTPYVAHYVQAELGVAKGTWALKVGEEILSGDPSRAGHRFQTPLATLHPFQGWADKFLVTPPKGIEDRYVSVGGKLRAFNLQAAWHDFRADATSAHYGREWDALVSVPFAQRYEAQLKWADYRADGFSTDTRKLWFLINASFP
jgi:hypothetical protein